MPIFSVHKLQFSFKNRFFSTTGKKVIKWMHLLKRDDLSAHLEVNKCLNISPLFQTIFALLFGHYIEWISKIADCKKILYRCYTFWISLCRMLSIWHLRCAAKSSLFQWVENCSLKFKWREAMYLLFYILCYQLQLLIMVPNT